MGQRAPVGSAFGPTAQRRRRRGGGHDTREPSAPAVSVAPVAEKRAQNLGFDGGGGGGGGGGSCGSC
jgi:hypothetical protein